MPTLPSLLQEFIDSSGHKRLPPPGHELAIIPVARRLLIREKRDYWGFAHSALPAAVVLDSPTYRGVAWIRLIHSPNRTA